QPRILPARAARPEVERELLERADAPAPPASLRGAVRDRDHEREFLAQRRARAKAPGRVALRRTARRSTSLHGSSREERGEPEREVARTDGAIPVEVGAGRPGRVEEVVEPERQVGG